MQAEALTEFLHSGIPLTRALALQVVENADGRVRITAPLAPNLNPHGTAFGGSLAALGIVGGWAVIHQGLLDAGLDVDLVVKKSELEYLRPAPAELSIESSLPQDAWPEVLARLRGGHRARISITSRIYSAGSEAMRAHGVYVALPKTSG